MHLELFCYGCKLSAKWAELVQLMQKFVPRTRVGCFHNEHIQSTPLDPKLIFFEFLSVWVHLGLFCYGSKLSAKWAELVQLMQKFVPQSCVRSFRNERT